MPPPILRGICREDELTGWSAGMLSASLGLKKPPFRGRAEEAAGRWSEAHTPTRTCTHFALILPLSSRRLQKFGTWISVSDGAGNFRSTVSYARA